jgi:hypothetical protein
LLTSCDQPGATEFVCVEVEYGRTASKVGSRDPSNS